MWGGDDDLEGSREGKGQKYLRHVMYRHKLSTINVIIMYYKLCPSNSYSHLGKGFFLASGKPEESEVKPKEELLKTRYLRVMSPVSREKSEQKCLCCG